MKRKKIVSMLLASAMAATLLAGCGAGGKSSSKGDSDGEIKEFTAFFAVPGSEINDDNEVQQIIAEKTGAKVKETWLTEESIRTLLRAETDRCSYMMPMHWLHWMTIWMIILILKICSLILSGKN